MMDPVQPTDPAITAHADDTVTMERLLPLVYDELRRIAHCHLDSGAPDRTLGTTALVHEAYLRLADQRRGHWVDRTHFLAVASTMMRRVLIDYARRHQTARRGGGHRPVPLDAAALLADQRADELVALDAALTRLATLDGRLARVIECRFFGGLTEAETAAVLDVTERTVRRDWVKARGWLYDELRDDLA